MVTKIVLNNCFFNNNKKIKIRKFITLGMYILEDESHFRKINIRNIHVFRIRKHILCSCQIVYPPIITVSLILSFSTNLFKNILESTFFSSSELIPFLPLFKTPPNLILENLFKHLQTSLEDIFQVYYDYLTFS